jgi:hypothetical protein
MFGAVSLPGMAVGLAGTVRPTIRRARVADPHQIVKGGADIRLAQLQRDALNQQPPGKISRCNPEVDW